MAVYESFERESSVRTGNRRLVVAPSRDADAAPDVSADELRPQRRRRTARDSVPAGRAIVVGRVDQRYPEIAAGIDVAVGEELHESVLDTPRAPVAHFPPPRVPINCRTPAFVRSCYAEPSISRHPRCRAPRPERASPKPRPDEPRSPAGPLQH